MSKSSGRYIITWSTAYDDVDSAHEAVVVALGDLEDMIKNVGQGANAFMVEDVVTGTVSIITSDVALSTVRGTTNIINIDQSINYSPSITINAGNSKSKHGKKGKDAK